MHKLTHALTALIFLNLNLTAYANDNELEKALTNNSWCRMRYSGTYQTVKMTFQKNGTYYTAAFADGEPEIGYRGTWKLDDNYLQIWLGYDHRKTNIDIYKKYDSMNMTVIEKDKWGFTKTWQFIECE